MPSLTELTVCSWMKSSDRKNDGTVFSYAVPGMDNEFIIYNYKNFQIFVNSTVFSYAVPGMDNEFIIYNYKNFQIFVNRANR